MALQIEMVLTTATHFAVDTMTRPGNRPLGFADGHNLRRVSEQLLLERLLDIEDRRAYVILNINQRSGSVGLVITVGGNSNHRRPDIVDEPSRQNRFAVEHRTHIVDAGNIVSRHDRAHAVGSTRCRYVDGNDAGMGVGAGHQHHFQGARQHGHVVDITRPARNMAAGTVMADLGVDRTDDVAVDGHNAITSTSSAPSRSRNSRTNKFPATRNR